MKYFIALVLGLLGALATVMSWFFLIEGIIGFIGGAGFTLGAFITVAVKWIGFQVIGGFLGLIAYGVVSEF